MPIQKIKSGRIITVQAETYVGEKGIIFYDEDTGLLRLSDGVTPGGIPVQSNTGTTSTYVLPPATTSTLGGVIVGENLSISPEGVISFTGTASFTATVNAFTTVVVQGYPDMFASGNDSLEFVAGRGIALVAESNIFPKAVTISISEIDGGFPDSTY